MGTIKRLFTMLFVCLRDIIEWYVVGCCWLLLVVVCCCSLFNICSSSVFLFSCFLVFLFSCFLLISSKKLDELAWGIVRGKDMEVEKCINDARQTLSVRSFLSLFFFFLSVSLTTFSLSLLVPFILFSPHPQEEEMNNFLERAKEEWWEEEARGKEEEGGETPVMLAAACGEYNILCVCTPSPFPPPSISPSLLICPHTFLLFFFPPPPSSFPSPQTLIQAGGKINKTDKKGRSPLFFASLGAVFPPSSPPLSLPPPEEEEEEEGGEEGGGAGGRGVGIGRRRRRRREGRRAGKKHVWCVEELLEEGGGEGMGLEEEGGWGVMHAAVFGGWVFFDFSFLFFLIFDF